MARRKKFRPPKITTVLGPCSEIAGDIHFKGGLHVDGAVKGNILADQDQLSTLTLSEQGSIEGDVRVPNVILNGTVTGNVYASERVELAPKAKINGNVYYNMLEMAMGSEVNGQLIHSDEGQKMLDHQTDEDPESTSEVSAEGEDEDFSDDAQVSTRERRGREL